MSSECARRGMEEWGCGKGTGGQIKGENLWVVRLIGRAESEEGDDGEWGSLERSTTVGRDWTGGGGNVLYSVSIRLVHIGNQS